MALKGKQKNIDANKDGRISAEDFQILRSRQRGGMKKKMGGGLMAATQKLKSQGKMGGGMMMKPIMANKGSKIDLDKRNKSFFSGFSKVFKGPQDSGRVATIGGVKPKLTRSDRRKKRKTFKSLQEMRTAKGFRPGETPKQFNQRKELAKFAKEGVRATRLGKIILPIALAGVGAVQYLKSKMNKNKERQGDLEGSTKPYKVNKKMGGGMMMKPIMADKGIMAQAGKTGYKKLLEKRKRLKAEDIKGASKDVIKGMGGYMGGGMMNMPGYKKGKSVMAKGCKLGRKKPTKMYT
jgi:hypothetical protein